MAPGYLGAGTIVEVAHPDVTGGLVLDYGDDGSTGWDQFGRVTSQTWTNDAATTTFDDFDYTYDRGSNRLTRDLSLTTGLDEKYTYDGLGRLTNTERGTLSGGSITNLAFEQDWDLDELGNWAGFEVDDDGDQTLDLDQTRTHNDANEITGLSGGSWVDPVHDAAGNMKLAARPGAEDDTTAALLLEYDAWNRLVLVNEDEDGDGEIDAGEAVVGYKYDGQRRRIWQFSMEGTRAYVYNAGWQVTETYLNGDPDPQKQYVWDLRYVDSPVVRFHDGGTDGTIDDTMYYTTDASFNVTALIEDDGTVAERYAYDPYGQVTVLDADWSADADGASDVDNEVLYAGYRYDSETGLYHVRNRMYHATLGRFVQRDPLGYVDGMNVYQYVGGRPTRTVDPSGLEDEFDHSRMYDVPLHQIQAAQNRANDYGTSFNHEYQREIDAIDRERERRVRESAQREAEREAEEAARRAAEEEEQAIRRQRTCNFFRRVTSNELTYGDDRSVRIFEEGCHEEEAQVLEDDLEEDRVSRAEERPSAIGVEISGNVPIGAGASASGGLGFHLDIDNPDNTGVYGKGGRKGVRNRFRDSPCSIPQFVFPCRRWR